ncbi:MAG: metal ABC transporter permease [Pseudanabaenaceae cyanobacterium bins.68]|nr:metal ABC transporter permease [Pseudanabaenaceae cyanobacterium bins.68]
MNWLLEPLTYEFMRNAIASGMWAAIICPVIGSYLIVQRMALLGDVIAHAVLPGLVLAVFFKFDLLIGAIASGMLAALIITLLRSQTKVKIDAAMALIFSSFFGTGILLISLLKIKVDLDALLFGDILAVKGADVWRTGWICLGILAIVRLFYKELLFYTFDPLGAEAVGLPVNLLYFGLITAITLTIVASMQTMGVVLIIALLVGPALTAYMWVQELWQMMLLGMAIALVTVIAGMYLSYYLNLPSGAAIVVISFAKFVLGLGLHSLKQQLVRSSHKSR